MRQQTPTPIINKLGLRFIVALYIGVPIAYGSAGSVNRDQKIVVLATIAVIAMVALLGSKTIYGAFIIGIGGATVVALGLSASSNNIEPLAILIGILIAIFSFLVGPSVDSQSGWKLLPRFITRLVEVFLAIGILPIISAIALLGLGPLSIGLPFGLGYSVGIALRLRDKRLSSLLGLLTLISIATLVFIRQSGIMHAKTFSQVREASALFILIILIEFVIGIISGSVLGAIVNGLTQGTEAFGAIAPYLQEMILPVTGFFVVYLTIIVVFAGLFETI